MYKKTNKGVVIKKFFFLSSFLLAFLIFGFFSLAVLAQIPKEISFSNENPKPPVLTGIKNPVASKKINAFIQKFAKNPPCDDGGDYDVTFSKNFESDQVISFLVTLVYNCKSMPYVAHIDQSYNVDLQTGNVAPISKWVKKDVYENLKKATLKNLVSYMKKNEFEMCLESIEARANDKDYKPEIGSHYLISSKKEVLLEVLYGYPLMDRDCPQFVGSGFFIK